MNTIEPLTAVVLAGGTRDEVCRDDPHALNKAFVHVNGSPMVTRTLRALCEASSIARIIVVAPSEAAQEPLMLADERRLDGRRIGDSLLSGLEGLDPNALVLISASDLPLLTPMAVDDFVYRVQTHYSDCDLAYGYLDQHLHERHYPAIRHTWARFREGTLCGTGFCVLRPRVLPALLRVLEAVAAARKAPWRLASMLGPRILVQYALGILGIGDTEDRASAILGHRARGVPSHCPESAVNIDRYSDLTQISISL